MEQGERDKIRMLKNFCETKPSALLESSSERERERGHSLEGLFDLFAPRSSSCFLTLDDNDELSQSFRKPKAKSKRKEYPHHSMSLPDSVLMSSSRYEDSEQTSKCGYECDELAKSFEFLNIESPKDHSRFCPLSSSLSSINHHKQAQALHNFMPNDSLLSETQTLHSLHDIETPHCLSPDWISYETQNKKPLNQDHILVLDLDETLVHCVCGFDPRAHTNIDVVQDGSSCLLSVFLRPYLAHFLETAKALFGEIVVFTAARESYANTILNIIDPKRIYFSRRFYRDSCAFVNGQFKKDLRVVSEDLSHVVLVDNTPSVLLQPENGYVISSFFTNPFDSALLTLENDLMNISSYSDIRMGLSEHCKRLLEHNIQLASSLPLTLSSNPVYTPPYFCDDKRLNFGATNQTILKENQNLFTNSFVSSHADFGLMVSSNLLSHASLYIASVKEVSERLSAF